jgi:nicotinamide-nucleotide amidase
MPDFEKQVNDLVNRIAVLLMARGWKMATAESCTGGWIAKCCTDVAGSSEWFEHGFVSYSYDAKELMLGISHDDLLKHGAVSEEIARQMATGAKQGSKVDVAVAVTGIAGPGGAAPGKPVGLVHFCWRISDLPPYCDVATFDGDRNSVRQQTVLHALQGIISRVDTQV